MSLRWSVLFKIALALPVLFVATGLIVWAATARNRSYYLRASQREGAVAGLWIAADSTQRQKTFAQPLLTTFSVWVNPQRTRQAFANFDTWIDEFSIIRDEVEESSEDEAELLPPFPIPPDDSDTSDAHFLLPDSYDIATSEFLHNLWHSGFISLGGSVFLNTPVWAKPLSGWSVVVARSRSADHFYDRLLSRFSERDDGSDFPSWAGSVPSAHIPSERTDRLVNQVVFDLGARELAELLTSLCELENLSEKFCTTDDPEANPLLPLYLVSDAFRVQFNVYWSVRGQHLLWSNREDCLLSLLSEAGGLARGCGSSGASGMSGVSPDFSVVDSQKSLQSGEIQRHGDSDVNAAGFWVNQVVLKNLSEQIIREFDKGKVEGASWVFDRLVSAHGNKTRAKIEFQLADWAQRQPLWGANLAFSWPDIGELSTYIQSSEKEQPQFSEIQIQKQFNLLSSVLWAWFGSPNSTSRLLQSKSWERDLRFWKKQSFYRIGWSDQE